MLDHLLRHPGARRALRPRAGVGLPPARRLGTAGYRAYGLEDGVDLALPMPKVVVGTVQMMQGGRQLQRPHEDPLQLGGDFVVDPTGLPRARAPVPGPDGSPAARRAGSGRGPRDRRALKALTAAAPGGRTAARGRRPWRAARSSRRGARHCNLVVTVTPLWVRRLRWAKLQLTLACGDYDLTRGLIEGTTPPQGIDLVVLTMASPERHWRMTKGQEFDVCEFSMASYLASREAGLPFTAIPAFPHRRFRHSFMVVNATRASPSRATSRGKRVGLRTWQTTAGVWQRGMLPSEYGLPWTRYGGSRRARRTSRCNCRRASRLERLPADANLDAMLADGELKRRSPGAAAVLARGDSACGGFPRLEGRGASLLPQDGHLPDHAHRRHPRRDSEGASLGGAERLAGVREVQGASVRRRLENPRTVSLAWMRDLLEERARRDGRRPVGLRLRRDARQR